METLWVLLFISVVLIILNKFFGFKDIIRKKLNPLPPEPEYPYCKKNLLNSYETEFFKKIKSLADEYSLTVNIKTNLNNIADVKNSENQTDDDLKKFNSAIADFIISDPDSMSAECIIKLSDDDGFIKKFCEKNNIDFILYNGDFNEIISYFDENWEKQE